MNKISSLVALAIVIIPIGMMFPHLIRQLATNWSKLANWIYRLLLCYAVMGEKVSSLWHVTREMSTYELEVTKN